MGEYMYVGLRKEPWQEIVKQLGKLLKKAAKDEEVRTIEPPRIATIVDDSGDGPVEYIQVPFSLKGTCAVKCGSTLVDLADVLSSTSVVGTLAFGVSFSAEIGKKAPLAEDQETRICECGNLKLTAYAIAMSDVSELVGVPMGESAQLEELAPSKALLEVLGTEP